MLPIKHILYPIDFSPRSLEVAPTVEAYAKLYGAKVTLFSAIEPIIFPGSEGGAPMYIDAKLIREDLQKRLENRIPDLLSGDVTAVAEIGEPSYAITNFAHANKVDLIMMPTHGRGVFRRLLLGSVTSKVLHDAECPVWTTSHTEEGHCKPIPAKILCAVDLSLASTALVQWAQKLAKDTGASLRLVHAVPGTAAWPERQFNVELEQSLKDGAAAKLKSAGFGDISTCIYAGDVAWVVSEEAKTHGADMIVIGRGEIHETFGRLRTQAHAIIRQAPCSVISV
jgi:nucleotide-binding universal stress UspA family protein